MNCTPKLWACVHTSCFCQAVVTVMRKRANTIAKWQDWLFRNLLITQNILELKGLRIANGSASWIYRLVNWGPEGKGNVCLMGHSGNPNSHPVVGLSHSLCSVHSRLQTLSSLRSLHTGILPRLFTLSPAWTPTWCPLNLCPAAPGASPCPLLLQSNSFICPQSSKSQNAITSRSIGWCAETCYTHTPSTQPLILYCGEGKN